MNQHLNRAVPTYIFNSNNNLSGNNFRARPLKQWRKQLSSSNLARSLGNSNASIGMPMDRPGGSTSTSTSTCNINNNSSACYNASLLEEEIIKDSPCTSCQPIKPIITISDTSYTDNKAYMQSRCVTYDQKQAYNPAPNVTYFSTAGIPIEPSPDANGTQVRETNNCYMPLKQQNNSYYGRCNTTIYKPNNVQFAQQGGVSSGSRISRLKYNTQNGYGAAYNSASGAVGINSGYYQTEPSPSYYNKIKPQQVVYPYIIGNKNYCPTEASC
jgi:hypothetical protein